MKEFEDEELEKDEEVVYEIPDEEIELSELSEEDQNDIAGGGARMFIKDQIVGPFKYTFTDASLPLNIIFNQVPKTHYTFAVNFKRGYFIIYPKSNMMSKSKPTGVLFRIRYWSKQKVPTYMDFDLKWAKDW